MKLELASHNVGTVQFGGKTELRDGALFINRDELVSYLLEDRNFAHIDIEISHPGDMTRIINVLDIVDARKKASDEVEVFPGFIGKVGPVGEGRTHIVRGVSIVETGQGEGLFGGIIDMAGEGSRYSPYSKTHNVVLIPTPSEGIRTEDYVYSLKRATLKTSVYLGKASLPAPPDGMESMDFEFGRRKAGPRIGYIWQVLSHYGLRKVYYYGKASHGFFPVVMRPNDIADGALVSGHYDHSPALKNYTGSILNNPVVMNLQSRHGKEIDFAGIILANSPTTVDEKIWNASMSAQLARSFLECDGVIITKEGGGHCDIDLMRTCKECERLGIKTSLIDLEMLGPNGDGEYPLVVFEPEADAIVSAGNCEERTKISAMKNIIGGTEMKELGADAGAEKWVPIRLIAGAISELGMGRIKGEWY